VTDTTFAPAGAHGPPGPAPERRRRLVVGGALLALAVALVSGYLILGGSGSTSTAGPVPHVVRSPNSPVQSTPARPPTAAKPTPGAVVVRNPFLPLVAPPAAGTTATAAPGTAASATPATGTGAGSTGSGSTGSGSTAGGTTGTGATSGTGGSGGDAAKAAAAVDGTPNYTG